MVERLTESVAADVERECGESVDRLVVASRVGAWGALAKAELAGQLAQATGLPLSGWFTAKGSRIERSDGLHTDLPGNFLIALTEANLLVYSYRDRWGWVRLRRRLGGFPRERLEVYATDRTVSKRFVLLDRPGEQIMVFEIFGRHRADEEFAQAIGTRTCASAAELVSAIGGQGRA